MTHTPGPIYTPEGEAKQGRLEGLVQHWQDHCQQAGHTPRMEGGDATYDASYDATYIRCCVKGCDWSYSREVGFSRLPTR